MKPFVKIFLPITLLAVLVSVAFAGPGVSGNHDKDTVSLTPTQYKDLLVLKTTKSFMGATVEVHDATGALVASSSISKKKMILDFYDIPYGAYTIQIFKNAVKVLEFTHIKKLSSGVFN